MENFAEDFMPANLKAFRKTLPGYNEEEEGTQFPNGLIGVFGVLSLSTRDEVLRKKNPGRWDESYVTLRFYDEINMPSFGKSIHFKWNAINVYYRQSFGPSEKYPWGVAFLLLNNDGEYYYKAEKNRDAQFIYYEYKVSKFSDHKERVIDSAVNSHSSGHTGKPGVTEQNEDPIGLDVLEDLN